jgi:hypothetical protein
MLSEYGTWPVGVRCEGSGRVRPDAGIPASEQIVEDSSNDLALRPGCGVVALQGVASRTSHCMSASRGSRRLKAPSLQGCRRPDNARSGDLRVHLVFARRSRMTLEVQLGEGRVPPAISLTPKPTPPRGSSLRFPDIKDIAESTE